MPARLIIKRKCSLGISSLCRSYDWYVETSREKAICSSGISLHGDSGRSEAFFLGLWPCDQGKRRDFRLRKKFSHCENFM